MINANRQLGVALSSARYKRDIAPLGVRSAGVFELRSVIVPYHDDGSGVTQFGLIAEEVAAVYPELVTHSLTGEVQSVRYQELIALLLNELQRQHRDLQQRQQALERQQAELSELRALVEQRRGQPPQPASLMTGSTRVVRSRFQWRIAAFAACDGAMPAAGHELRNPALDEKLGLVER